MRDVTSAVIIIIMAMGVALFIIMSVVDVYENIITDCHEYKKVKYRYEGTGGLFGGTKKIIIHKDSTNFDGYEKMCIKGSNWRGKKITNGNN